MPIYINQREQALRKKVKYAVFGVTRLLWHYILLHDTFSYVGMVLKRMSDNL